MVTLVVNRLTDKTAWRAPHWYSGGAPLKPRRGVLTNPGSPKIVENQIPPEPASNAWLVLFLTNPKLMLMSYFSPPLIEMFALVVSRRILLVGSMPLSASKLLPR